MIVREIEIAAPRSCVYSVISDLSSYPEFLSTTQSVHLSEVTASSCDAEFRVQLIKEIKYSLRFKFNEPKGLSWSLIRGDFMKKNSGSWELQELSHERTLAIYKIDIAFGFMVPKKIVEALTSVQLPELLAAFTQRAENLYQEGAANG